MKEKARIEELKAEVQRLGGDQAVMWGIDQLPPDVAEEFLKRVIAFEESEQAGGAVCSQKCGDGSTRS